MRVVFLGSDAWSVPSLEALSGVELVVTRAPRPAGRGSVLTPTSVAEAARTLRLPLAEVDTVKEGEGFDRIVAAEPEVLAVVAYGEILTMHVLRVPTVGSVNLHFSLLPEFRGAAPVQRALMSGHAGTGVSTILMDEGMDSGPILMQREEDILPNDDAGSLGGRLAGIGADLLVETLDRLAARELVPRPQDEREASFAPKISAAERLIDWTEDAQSVVRRVRALAPSPGASARFRDDVLKILRAEPAEVSGRPGEVLSAGKDGFVVGAGSGAVRPLEVAPAGRKHMSAEEFVRGFRPAQGESLVG
ncbi:MAG: methionyl-tRNA formyltransferase [Actinomycetota bacterium]